MRYGWELKLAGWQRLQAWVPKDMWERAYLEADYASTVPQEPGVYLICACPKEIPMRGVVWERLYNAIYVGQATNLRTRFRQHVRGARGVLDAKSTFRRLDFWHIRQDVATLNDVEQALIDALGPSANTINVRARIEEAVPAGRVGQ